MQPKKQLNIFDLLQDEGFHAWALGHSTKKARKWDRYFMEYPDQLLEAEEARKFLLNLQFRKRDVPEDIVNSEWEKLGSRINHSNNPVTSNKLQSNKRKNYNFTLFSLGFIILAVIFVTYNLYKAFVSPKQLKWQEIVMPVGSKSMVILPDSTRVWLNSGSSLKYPEMFGSMRDIVLSGEAFFNTQPIVQKPFIIRLPSLNIEASGGRFNICAYPSDSIYKITLLEGSVILSVPNQAGYHHPAIRLLPGQEAKFDPLSGKFIIEHAKASNNSGRK